MSFKQLEMTAQPIWQSKPAIEKLIAKVMLGFAAIAAGNSGFQWALSTQDTPAQVAALERSLLAGAATGLGALGLILIKRTQPRVLTEFMSLAVGAMLAAALFSLLLPAAQMTAGEQWPTLALAMGLGAAMMYGLDRAVPHAHVTHDNDSPISSRAVWLLVAAISLHNLPEGFAVGATATTASAQANSTALAIALQNVPEGLIVATALWTAGMSKPIAALFALATGLIEPLGALLGAAMVGEHPRATPMALAFAAGAMLFVVLHEMVPPLRRQTLASRRLLALGSASFAGMWALNQLSA